MLLSSKHRLLLNNLSLLIDLINRSGIFLSAKLMIMLCFTIILDRFIYEYAHSSQDQSSSAFSRSKVVLNQCRI